jgi:outer membrane protein assembly factor BamB
MLNTTYYRHHATGGFVRLIVAWALIGGVNPFSQHAFALEERWHFDVVSSARSLPAVVDQDGDGFQEIYVSTRFDGSVWCVNSNGTLRSRHRRANWVEGSVAISVPIDERSRLFAFQESTGLLNLANFGTGLNMVLDLPGEPRLGTAPCFGDLNRSGRQEIVCARRDGILSALDRRLSVLWRYDAQSSFDASPVVAPVFMDSSAVYVQSVDGIVHCVQGDGVPLWRFKPDFAAAAFPSHGDLLVVELVPGNPSVLASDAQGWLYAVDVLTGRELWRCRAGTAALGSPAIVDLHDSAGREVITVSARGEIAVVGATGNLLEQAALPEGAYIPRPLVADVDGDGEQEIVLATNGWRIVVASLAGAIKEEMPVRGQIREGLILADLDGDETLELIAATECARLYCFATAARSGWTHPRAGSDLSGCVLPISSAYRQAQERGERRHPRQLRITVPDLNPERPFATAVVDLPRSYRNRNVVAVLRQQDRVIGATVASAKEGPLTVPYYRDNRLPLELDLTLESFDGRKRTRYEAIPIHTSRSIPVLLPSRDEFITALSARGQEFTAPTAWALPTIQGKDSWTVATYMPQSWAQYGLADQPFIRDAIPRIDAPATETSRMFSSDHPAWMAMKNSTTPFFLMNGYFQPAGRYPDAVYDGVVDMAGDRFLGFPVHEWAYPVWKEQLEGAPTKPGNRDEATRIFAEDFQRLLHQTHGRIYAGEGYCMIAHQAYAWGAPMCYAEIGENMPCVPLQLAMIRGAARQYGNKPWGAYISNWFRGAALDSRYRHPKEPRVQWSPPDTATGLDCGHSPSLEFRLAMAAHLSGATLVHHESDAFHGSVFVRENPADTFSLSAHGAAFSQWYDFSALHGDRGVPYTPIAFMVDFDHGWRPLEKVYGVWEPDRGAASLEEVFTHIYNWEGRLDFERGYLPNGPYGDVFDVVTDDAASPALANYGVVWLLGDIDLTQQHRRVLEDYVKGGGILVLDSAHATAFSSKFLGVSLARRALHATGIQTALQSLSPIPSPFPYRALTLGDDARALAWTESGAPLVAWKRVEDGAVIVAATDHWLDSDRQLVPVMSALLRSLVDAFVPISVAADVQFVINQTERGYVAGLINNNGVTKVPTEPAYVDARGERECIITFTGGAPKRFESRMGEFRWNVDANGLQTIIPPGGVAVVEIFTSL